MNEMNLGSKHECDKLYLIIVMQAKIKLIINTEGYLVPRQMSVMEIFPENS